MKTLFKKSFILSATCLLLSSFGKAQAPTTWTTTGGNNLSGTLPLTPVQWLGSSNAADLIFKTTNVERARINSIGNVMIGAVGINPTEKLQIKNGNILLDYWASGVGNLYIGGKTDLGTDGMRFSFQSAGNGMMDVRTTALTNGLIFRVDNSIGGTERMRINANGNVGIGNSTPVYKLSVQTGANNDGLQIKQSGSSAAAIHLDNVGTGGHNWAAFSTGTGNPEGTGNFNIYDYGVGGSGGGGTRFLISGSTGNVGIGTGVVQPTAKLTVNGDVLIGDPSVITLPVGYKLYVQTGILTEKVKVALASTVDWADYVFDKNYKLLKLNDVEKYISANKHLPGVPSAADVVKEGIDLGKMDAKLLEKIEELTLYVIEQDKKIKNVEEKNEQLLIKLESLSAKK